MLLTNSTHMALISKSKVEDMEFRMQLLECMESCLRSYKKTGDKHYLDRAMEFGKMSKDIKDRLDKGDYTKRDERMAKQDAADKSYEQAISLTKESPVI